MFARCANSDPFRYSSSSAASSHQNWVTFDWATNQPNIHLPKTQIQVYTDTEPVIVRSAWYPGCMYTRSLNIHADWSHHIWEGRRTDTYSIAICWLHAILATAHICPCHMRKDYVAGVLIVWNSYTHSDKLPSSFYGPLLNVICAYLCVWGMILQDWFL